MADRSFSGTTPADTNSVRIAMVFENVGGGDTDAYIDDVKILLTGGRSEEHTSELQSLMRISYAVFCLKKKKRKQIIEILTTSNTRSKQRMTQIIPTSIH